MEVPRNQVRQHVQRRPAPCYQGLLWPVPVHPLIPGRRRRHEGENHLHLRTNIVGGGNIIVGGGNIRTNFLARREGAMEKENPVPRTRVRLRPEEQHLQAAFVPQGQIPNPRALPRSLR